LKLKLKLKLDFGWLWLALLGFAWLCLALIGFDWLCLALLCFALFGSYYPKIDARPIVAYLLWAPYRSVWLLQFVTDRPEEILPNIRLTTAPIGPLNC
jgi:hypothetical protein